MVAGGTDDRYEGLVQLADRVPDTGLASGSHAQQRQRVPQRGLVPVGAVGDRVERLPEPCCHVLGHPALGEQRGNVGQRQIVVVGPVVLATALPAAVGLGVGQPLEPLQRKLGMVVDGWHHALGHQFAVSVEPAVGAAGDRVDRRPRADGAVVMLDDLHVTDGQLGKADLTATTPAVGDLEEVDARPVGAVDARGGPPGVGRQRPPTVLGFDHRLVAGLVAVGVLVETDQRGRHADEQVGAAVVRSPPDDLVVVGVDAVVLVSGEPPNRALVARSPGGDHSRPASLTVGEHASRIDGVVLARLTTAPVWLVAGWSSFVGWDALVELSPRGHSSCGELTRESPPRSAEAVDRRRGREREGAASLRDNPAAPA